MTYNLVIVESATKANVIAKYLNESEELKHMGKFMVIASQGHVRDISKEKMGINMDTFDCDFAIKDDKKKIVSNLKKHIDNAKMVYLAADNDREGEGIAWHLREYFRLSPKKYKRILFNEITKRAIVHAVLHPVDINKHMVEAYLTRRILDRFVGFMITKLLWKSFDSNITLSAGRVQSATLKIIHDKEKEIADFKSEPYWTVKGDFGNHLSDTTLYHKNIVWKVNKDTIKSVLAEKLSKATFKLSSCEVKENIKEKPPLPFTTSTLQQVGYGEFGSITRIMAIAQQLYEMGAITYMRTDSTNISVDMSSKIKKYIEETYSAQYVGERGEGGGGRMVGGAGKQQKHAQEAHEAIRPTTLKFPFPKKMTDEQQRMYGLIYKRTVAAFMADALYTEATVKIENNKMSKDYMFVGKHKIVQFQGWLKLYNNDGKYNVSSVDGFVSKCTKMNKIEYKTITGKCTWTIPPPRFNESSLVNILEKSGIGRPSTYASILLKLTGKQYIHKATVQGEEKTYTHYVLKSKNNKIMKETENKFVGAENNKLVPLEIGIIVNDFVSKTFPKITDTEFTSIMEDSIDKIAHGRIPYKQYLSTFYNKDFKVQYFQTLNALTSKSDNKPKKKQELGKEEIEVNDKIVHSILNDKHKKCILRITRYGPVIEVRHDKEDVKSDYINIKPYMQETNKTSIKEMTPKEISLLISLPLTLKYNNKMYDIMFGRYGFYIKGDQKNYKIYKNLLPHLFEGKYEMLMKSLKI
jgi:DNA topoisomerase-1